jgi:hypothetical protein
MSSPCRAARLSTEDCAQPRTSQLHPDSGRFAYGKQRKLLDK